MRSVEYLQVPVWCGVRPASLSLPEIRSGSAADHIEAVGFTRNLLCNSHLEPLPQTKLLLMSQLATPGRKAHPAVCQGAPVCHHPTIPRDYHSGRDPRVPLPALGVLLDSSASPIGSCCTATFRQSRQA